MQKPSRALTYATSALTFLATQGCCRTTTPQEVTRTPQQPTTNTLPIHSAIHERETNRTYSIDEVIIDGRLYMAKQIPEGYTARIGNAVLNRKTIASSYLIPTDNSRETIGLNEVELNNRGELYTLVNIIKNNKGIELNRGENPITSRFVYSMDPLEETRQDPNGFEITEKRTVSGATRQFNVVEFKDTGKFYKFFAINKTIPNALNACFIADAVKPLTIIERANGKTQTKRTIEGFGYVPVQAVLVPIPKPKIPQPKKPQQPTITEILSTQPSN